MFRPWEPRETLQWCPIGRVHSAAMVSQINVLKVFRLVYVRAPAPRKYKAVQAQMPPCSLCSKAGL
eukprot:6172529-Pleurochrysis_carterae.AAC.3